MSRRDSMKSVRCMRKLSESENLVVEEVQTLRRHLVLVAVAPNGNRVRKTFSMGAFNERDYRALAMNRADFRRQARAG